jgi:hypothetical protein
MNHEHLLLPDPSSDQGNAIIRLASFPPDGILYLFFIFIFFNLIVDQNTAASLFLTIPTWLLLLLVMFRSNTNVTSLNLPRRNFTRSQLPAIQLLEESMQERVFLGEDGELIFRAKTDKYTTPESLEN